MTAERERPRLDTVTDYAWDPRSFLDLMHAEIADYPALQEQLVAGTTELRPELILDLGCGTGETARRVLAAHPSARLVGVDSSAEMLAVARAMDRVTVHQRDLADALPDGPFDLAVSALAVHHLDGPGKAALFHRVARALRPGGRFVLADLVVPEDPADVHTEIDGVYDLPSSAADALRWLADAGFTARVRWSYRDLAVIVADRPD